MGRTAVDVDVGAVEVVVDDRDVSSQPAQSFGRGEARGAVGGIEGNGDPLEGHTLGLDRVDGMLDVDFHGVFNGNDRAHRIAGNAVGHRQTAGHRVVFHLLFKVDRQLEAFAVEELDAVVFRRVVGRRNHDAPVGVELARKEGHRRRGNHAEGEHRAARRHDAGVEGGFEHVARKARVLAHGDRGAQKFHRRLAQSEGRLAGKVGVGNAARAVGSEKLAHYFPLFTWSGVSMTAPAGRSSARMRMLSSAANSSSSIP